MDEKENATARVLIATLQKFGYDLEDISDELRASSSTNSSSSSASSPANRTSVSSASILQLRERKNHQSALHIAVKKGHVEVLRALANLPRVQDHVNVGDRHANTPLHFAASANKEGMEYDMVELLLEMGASPTALNVRGQTPLAIHLMTAKYDDPTITKMLTKSGEVPLNELVVENSTTYLHLAVDRQLIEIAGALVAQGAIINLPDSNGVMVSDVVPKKTLIKLICYMQEGTQNAPVNVPRTSCKICKNPKGMLDTFKDCNLCGRTVCKNCSLKASEAKRGVSTGSQNTETGRLCNVCCTVIHLRDKQHKAKAVFNENLFGGSTK